MKTRDCSRALQDDEGTNVKPFLETHARLLPILNYDDATLQSQGTRDELRSLGEFITAFYSVHALMAFERYLDIISLRLGDRSFKDTFTLLTSDYFEKEFRRDPSQPGIVIGLALCKLRAGDMRRGRQLLLRIASSGFEERDVSRQILSKLVG